MSLPKSQTFNTASEITSPGIVSDASGNMTVLPGLKAKYDAWNRLVGVRDTSDNLIAEYSYNCQNQRIKKTVGSTVTKSFFNEKWQELESTTGTELTAYHSARAQLRSFFIHRSVSLSPFHEMPHDL